MSAETTRSPSPDRNSQAETAAALAASLLELEQQRLVCLQQASLDEARDSGEEAAAAAALAEQQASELLTLLQEAESMVMLKTHQVEQLQEDFDELNEDYKRCLAEQREMQAELTKTRELMEEERAKYHAEQLNLQEQKRDLCEQREDLEKRRRILEEREQMESSASEERESMRNELKLLQQTLEQRRSELERRERRLTQQSEEQQAVLKERDIAWSKRSAELECKRQEIEHQQQVLVEKEARLQEKLNRERELLLESRDSEKQQINMLHAQLMEKQEVLKNREDLLEKKAQEMQRDFEGRMQNEHTLATETQRVLADLNQQLKRAEEEESRLRKQIQQQASEHKAEVVRLQKEIQERTQRAEEDGALVKKLDVQLRALEAEHQSEQARQGREICALLDKLEKAQDKSRDAVRELEHVRKEHRHQAGLLIELHGKVDEYTKGSREAQEELERMRKQLEMKTEETNSHRKQLQEAQDQYNNMIRQRESEMLSHKLELHDLQKQLKEVSDAKAAMYTEVQSALGLCTWLCRSLSVRDNEMNGEEGTFVESFESLGAAVQGLQQCVCAVESILQEKEQEIRSMEAIMQQHEGALLVAQSEAHAQSEQLKQEQKRAEDQQQAYLELKRDMEFRLGREQELMRELSELSEALEVERKRPRQELDHQRAFKEQHMMLKEECEVLRQKYIQLRSAYQAATCLLRGERLEQDQEVQWNASLFETRCEKSESRSKLSICSEEKSFPTSSNVSDLLANRVSGEGQSRHNAEFALDSEFPSGKGTQENCRVDNYSVAPRPFGFASENLRSVCGHCLLQKAKALISGISYTECYCLTAKHASNFQECCAHTGSVSAALSAGVGDWLEEGKWTESWASLVTDAVEEYAISGEASDGDTERGNRMNVLWFIE